METSVLLFIDRHVHAELRSSLKRDVTASKVSFKFKFDVSDERTVPFPFLLRSNAAVLVV